MLMITLEHISKTYRQGNADIHVLSDVSLRIEKGERVAIVGASGSGKSTLLSLMSGLDNPDSGTVSIDGKDLTKLTKEELSILRNKHIGMIFQSFELVPSFTAIENIMLPVDISGDSGHTRAQTLLEWVGLTHRSNHLPRELSGGEQQRVAIARALAMTPQIIFADEPTGNLDQKTGDQILSVIFNNHQNELNPTIIFVTHDIRIAEKVDRVIEIRDGKLYERTP